MGLPWDSPLNAWSPFFDRSRASCYYGGPISSSTNYKEKFKQVRETLVAFFQEKGIFTEDHKKRLLSSPLDKA